jgi:hypothetical protein
MKYSKALVLSACVAMSGAVFAQAGGGNGNGGNSGTGGSGNAHGAATAGPTASPAAGGEPASGAMSSAAPKSQHHMSKSKSKSKKPMNDTTNTPGADASSDTKGQ